jgi:hypothetical protein
MWSGIHKLENQCKQNTAIGRRTAGGCQVREKYYAYEPKSIGRRAELCDAGMSLDTAGERGRFVLCVRYRSLSDEAEATDAETPSLVGEDTPTADLWPVSLMPELTIVSGADVSKSPAFPR